MDRMTAPTALPLREKPVRREENPFVGVPKAVPGGVPIKVGGDVPRVLLVMKSRSRVLARPSNKMLARILSSVANSAYDPKANEWTFDVAHYTTVVAALKQSGVAFEGIPTGTIALCTRTFPEETLERTDGIFGKLMRFQRSAVAFAINRGGRVLLADDMGLGKTVQALAIAEFYREDFPLLVVAPASLLNNWEAAVGSFLGEEATVIRQRCDFGGAISIVSYNQATTMIDVIASKAYGVVIADECHYLKSATSKRTKMLLPVLQQARRLVMISGTPAMSRPIELFPVISAYDKTVFPSFHAYGMRYCNGRKINNFYDFRGSSNAAELGMALENALMIRRTKDLVLSQLPKKFRRQVPIEAAKAQKATETGSHHAAVIGEAVSHTIMESFTEAASLKLPAVIDYLSTVTAKEIKSLVFAHHALMLDGIEEFCRSKGIPYIRIDGSTPASKRHAMVDAFQNNQKIRIAILSLTACSTGLTLTAAKAVVFAELYWNPGTMLQAEDRIHRIGQQDSVDIHYLVARGTVDEYVWPQLLRKLTVLESLGVGKNELKYVRKSTVDANSPNTLDGFFNK